MADTKLISTILEADMPDFETAFVRARPIPEGLTFEQHLQRLAEELWDGIYRRGEGMLAKDVIVDKDVFGLRK